jgi:hypothetical protein
VLVFKQNSLVDIGGAPVTEIKPEPAIDGENGTAWKLVEYEQLNEAGRTLYTAFYHLATMTFTWNASLGSAVAVSEYYKSAISSPVAFLLGLVISVVAIIYNLGALGGFSFIFGCFKLISTSMKDLGLPPYMQIVKQLDFIMTGGLRRGRSLVPLTVAFFCALIVAWVSISCWAMVSIVSWLVHSC